MSFRVLRDNEWMNRRTTGEIGVEEQGDVTTPRVELPLVSVIVVNFNYGRFLEEAVDSVYAQTYPRIECVVVDNGSTDESATVIETLKAKHPGIVVLRLPFNTGQSAGSLAGLAASKGRYIVFLDADDFLLPACVDTHVYVHLSMRKHVAFTSGDMLQVVDHDVVVANGEASSRLMQSQNGSPGLFRSYHHPGSNWPTDTLRASVESKVHYIKPRTARWVWSPTSGLCFRRDALLLFADNPALADLRTGTDIYFALGCGGLSGSVIIDEPVFAYRVHGDNAFTKSVQLDQVLAFTPGGAGDNNQLARRFLIDHLGRTAARFAPQLHLALHFLLMVLALDASQKDRTLPVWARRSHLALVMVREFESFAAVMSRPMARLVLAWKAKSLRAPRSLERSLERHTILAVMAK